MIEIDIKDFIPSGEFKHEPAATSRIVKGTLKGSDKIWYCKEIKDPALARIELMAQEFFRLFLQHQPETRIAIDHTTGTYYILSEEVPGYRDLPYGEEENFENGVYKFLGLILVIAMYVQETDLKNRNIGLNKDNYVTKIDGDACFSEKRWPNKYQITARSIEKLPYTFDFWAFNWLDLVDVGGKNPMSTIVRPSISNSPQFRGEINTALLQIALLPDSFIEQFVDTYMPAGGEYFINFFKSRRQELLVSAVENPSFLAYLEKPEDVSATAEYFMKQMKSFVAHGSTPIVPFEKQENLEEEIRRRIPEIKNAKLIHENQNLLNEIKKYSLGKQDTLFNHFVDDLNRRINDATHADEAPEKLRILKQELEKTLRFVSSNEEVKAVQDSIHILRKSAGLFTIGKNRHADAIEDALLRTPLEKRNSVISSKDCNAVQEALAMNPGLGKTKVIPKINGQIDEEKAAQPYKELKAKFTKKEQNEIREDKPIQSI